MKSKINFPAQVFLESNKKYIWCSCGRSENLPFCDGQHKGTEFSPFIFMVEENKNYKLCNCGNTKNTPFCDNTHKKLSK